MKSTALSLSAATLLLFSVSTFASAAEPTDSNSDSKSDAKSDGKWKPVWSDEFDGEKIDRTKWDFDLGNQLVSADGKTRVPGWGNDELEYYTDRPENVYVKDGLLHIKAI